MRQFSGFWVAWTQTPFSTRAQNDLNKWFSAKYILKIKQAIQLALIGGVYMYVHLKKKRKAGVSV